MPYSILDRFMSSYINQFGYIDDELRFFSQLALYIGVVWLSFLLIIKRGIGKALFSDNNKAAVAVIIFLLLNSLLYAVYYGGGGHTRLKVGLYVIIFLLVLMLKAKAKDKER